MLLEKNYFFLQVIFLLVFPQIMLTILFFLLSPYNVELLFLIVYKHIEFFIFMLILLIINDSKINTIFVTFFSMFLKFLYGFFHYNIFYYFQGYPMSMGKGFDEYTYYIFAKDFAPFVLEKSIYDMAKYVNFPINYMGYPYILSLIIRIFGDNNYYHIIINPILITLSGIIMYKFLENFTNFPKKMLNLYLALFLFSPSVNYFSILNVKDSLLLFLLSISFFAVAKIVLSDKIFIKIFYLIVLFIFSYSIFFIRAPFVVLPIVMLLLHLSTKYIVVFVGLISVFTQLFFSKILMFFRWEYIMLVFSKYKKWGIMQKYPFLILILLIFLPFLILLPAPIFYPLPPSVNTNISTEIFKIPIDIEYSLIFSILLTFFSSKKNTKFFVFLTGRFSYFKFTIIVFIILIISNYITYERHRLLLEVLLYLPLAYILYFKNMINRKLLFIFLFLIQNIILFFTYIRGLFKGVF